MPHLLHHRYNRSDHRTPDAKPDKLASLDRGTRDERNRIRCSRSHTSVEKIEDIRCTFCHEQQILTSSSKPWLCTSVDFLRRHVLMSMVEIILIIFDEIGGDCPRQKFFARDVLLEPLLENKISAVGWNSISVDGSTVDSDAHSEWERDDEENASANHRATSVVPMPSKGVKQRRRLFSSAHVDDGSAPLMLST